MVVVGDEDFVVFDLIVVVGGWFGVGVDVGEGGVGVWFGEGYGVEEVVFDYWL